MELQSLADNWMPCYRIDDTGLHGALGWVVLVRDQDGDVWHKAQATRRSDAIRLADRWIEQRLADRRLGRPE